MKPPRTAYTIMARNWLGFHRPVLFFRTALDLHRIPGLIPRLKDTMGGVTIRPLARRTA